MTAALVTDRISWLFVCEESDAGANVVAASPGVRLVGPFAGALEGRPSLPREVGRALSGGWL